MNLEKALKEMTRFTPARYHLKEVFYKADIDNHIMNIFDDFEIEKSKMRNKITELEQNLRLLGAM